MQTAYVRAQERRITPESALVALHSETNERPDKIDAEAALAYKNEWFF